MKKLLITIATLISLSLSLTQLASASPWVIIPEPGNPKGINETVLPLRGECKYVINNCAYPIGIPLHTSSETKSFFLNPPSCVEVKECTRIMNCPDKPQNSNWVNGFTYGQDREDNIRLPEDIETSHKDETSQTICTYDCDPQYHYSDKLCYENPICGNANNSNFYTEPTTSLCSVWTPSAVGWNWPWTRTCDNGIQSANCSANLKVDGVCGSANTTIPQTSTPTTNLCSAGTSTTPIVFGNSYRRNCIWINWWLNTSPSCSAAKNYCWDGYKLWTEQCDWWNTTYTCSSNPTNSHWTLPAWVNTSNGQFTSNCTNTCIYSPTTASCDWACDTNYSPSGNSCIADTQPMNCEARPGWATTIRNNSNTFIQTRNWTARAPNTSTNYNETTSTDDCRYKCNTSYHRYDNNCLSNSCGGSTPSSSTYELWSSSNTSGPAKSWTRVSTATSPWVCEYRCKAGTHRGWSSCISNSTTYTCTGKPSTNSTRTAPSWVNVSNGQFTASCSTDNCSYLPTTASCDWACDTNYSPSGNSCIADTQPMNCEARPGWATTIRNNSNTFIQTRNWTARAPNTSTNYNETTSTDDCRYKCNTSYHRYDNNCLSNSCGGSTPSSSTYELWSSSNTSGPAKSWTRVSTATSPWVCEYRCKAGTHRGWSSCISNSTTYTCTGKPSTNSTRTAPSWVNSSNGQFTASCSTDNCSYSPTTANCAWGCIANYTPSGNSCVYYCPTTYSTNINASSFWDTLPDTTPPAGAGNATSITITDTVDISNGSIKYDEGYACVNSEWWYFEGSNSTVTCDTNYSPSGNSCVADTQQGYCSRKQWWTDRNNSSYFIQTRNGTTRLPASKTAYYHTTQSSDDCRYKCSAWYHRDGNLCVKCWDDKIEGSEQCDDGSWANSNSCWNKCKTDCSWRTDECPSCGTSPDRACTKGSVVHNYLNTYCDEDCYRNCNTSRLDNKYRTRIKHRRKCKNNDWYEIMCYNNYSSWTCMGIWCNNRCSPNPIGQWY